MKVVWFSHLSNWFDMLSWPSFLARFRTQSRVATGVYLKPSGFSLRSLSFWCESDVCSWSPENHHAVLVRKVGEIGEVDGKTASYMLGVHDWDDQSDTCVDV